MAAVIPPVQAEAPAKGEPDAEGVLSDDKGKHYKVCETHQARMYEKTNKSGGSWFSHQLADGSWCKGGKA